MGKSPCGKVVRVEVTPRVEAIGEAAPISRSTGGRSAPAPVREQQQKARRERSRQERRKQGEGGGNGASGRRHGRALVAPWPPPPPLLPLTRPPLPPLWRRPTHRVRHPGRKATCTTGVATAASPLSRRQPNGPLAVLAGRRIPMAQDVGQWRADGSCRKPLPCRKCPRSGRILAAPSSRMPDRGGASPAARPCRHM